MPLYSLRFVLIRLDPIQQAWGVTVGTAIIQTQLIHRLAPQFLSQIPGAGSVALGLGDAGGGQGGQGGVLLVDKRAEAFA